MQAFGSVRRSGFGMRTSTLAAQLVMVRQRVNVNRARAKTWSREVPADPGLIRLYSDYLHEEYGPLDCDYVFVNLWAEPIGRPMTYAERRPADARGSGRGPGSSSPRTSSGTAMPPTCFVVASAAEVVQHLLGHASISTTIDTYSHLGIEDARRALVAAGLLDAQAKGRPGDCGRTEAGAAARDGLAARLLAAAAGVRLAGDPG